MQKSRAGASFIRTGNAEEQSDTCSRTGMRGSEGTSCIDKDRYGEWDEVRKRRGGRGMTCFVRPGCRAVAADASRTHESQHEAGPES